MCRGFSEAWQQQKAGLYKNVLNLHGLMDIRYDHADTLDFREGRPKKYSKAQMGHALELLDLYSYKKVSEMTGISVSSLQRAKREIQGMDKESDFPHNKMH